VPAGTKVLLASVVLSNPGIGETIRRVRGRLLVVSDQTANTELQFGALGAIVVTDVAATVGAGSIPGPVTEDNDDGWLLWEPVLQVSEASVGAADGAATIAQSIVFDSKGMRRVEEGFAMIFMFENAGTGDGLNVALSFSVLTSRIG